jgi:hypothetical protein
MPKTLSGEIGHAADPLLTLWTYLSGFQHVSPQEKEALQPLISFQKVAKNTKSGATRSLKVHCLLLGHYPNQLEQD